MYKRMVPYQMTWYAHKKYNSDCHPEVQSMNCILAIHKEKSDLMQRCIKISLFHINMKLNMFQVTHNPPSGA